MSNYQMRINFDRSSRTYQFGETISGKVVVESQAKFTIHNIGIEFYSRTHGKGNPDHGGKNIQLISSTPVRIQSGEHWEFPFAFTAPAGPVSYHGENINIDWYLLAYAHVHLPRDLKCEEDFILNASNSPSELIMGYPANSRTLPPPHQEIHHAETPLNPFNNSIQIQKSPSPFFPFFSAVLAGILSFGLFTFLINYADESSLEDWFIFGITVVVGYSIFIGLRSLPKLISEQKMKISFLQVRPTTVYAGEQVTISMRFETNSTVFLEEISAQLLCDEVYTIGGGSKIYTYTHNHEKFTFVKPYHEDLVAGSWIEFNCVFAIPPQGPATFEAHFNKIVWSAKLTVIFKHWPSWEKSFPITVLPVTNP